MSMRQCPDCKNEVSTTAACCPRCGFVDRQTSTGGLLAGALSFFVPGLGQLLQGRVVVGVIHFLSAILLWLIFMGWIIHIYSATNAAAKQ